MIKRKHTLKKQEVQVVIEKGQLLKGRWLIYYWQKSTNKQMKIAIAVSKKVTNNCQKNLIKRQLRMIIGQKANWSTPINLLVIAKKHYFDANFKQITHEVADMFEKIDKSSYERRTTTKQQ